MPTIIARRAPAAARSADRDRHRNLEIAVPLDRVVELHEQGGAPGRQPIQGPCELARPGEGQQRGVRRRDAELEANAVEIAH